MNTVAFFFSLKAHLSTAVIQSCNFSIMVVLVNNQNSRVCARAVTRVCFSLVEMLVPSLPECTH